MSHQQTNSAIIAEHRSKSSTTAALKRLVRNRLKGRGARKAAIARASVRSIPVRG